MATVCRRHHRAQAVALAVGLCVGLWGCGGSDGQLEPGPGTDAESVLGADVDSEAGPKEDTQVAACFEPLGALNDTVFVLEFDVAVIRVTGGSGVYTYELVSGDAAVKLNADTGVVLAQGEGGDVAEVRVIDIPCEQELTVQVQVVAPMVVTPLNAEVPPNTVIDFLVEEGSGSFEFELVSSETGGTLSAGTLTTGAQFGADRVRILDVYTRQEQEAIINTINRPSLRPTARNLLLLPGEQLAFTVEGGSGSIQYSMDASEVSFDPDVGLVEASGPVIATLTVTDTGLDLEETLAVAVKGAVGTEGNRCGDNTDRSAMLGGHDWNGDGLADLVVGVPEMDVESFDSGVAYIYAGSPDGGLSPTPVRVLSSTKKGIQSGEALTAGDFDGDGQMDLAVSATFDDAGVGNGGAIFVYRGLTEGGLSEEPAWVLGGAYRSDRLGMKLGACDLNADGVDDLLATTTEAENRALLQPFSSQGALFVFLGQQEKGLPLAFDQAIYGQTFDGQTLVQQSNLRLGVSLAVGDFNGDGACDAAVGSTNLGVDLGGQQEGPIDRDGGVFLYLGEHLEEGDEGGLNTVPARVWLSDVPSDPGSEYGRDLLMEDFDGDGFDDLVVTQERHNTPQVSGQNHGAVYLYRGEAVPTDFEDVPLSVADADWVYEGLYSNSRFGRSLATGDLNEDGSVDLLVGAPEVALPNTPTRSGAVAAFFGQPQGLPSAEADWVVRGTESEGRAGTSVAVVDGGVAYMVSRDDTFGLDLGRPYWDGDLETSSPFGLEVPGIGAGDRFGAAAAVVGDLGGDGYPDLAVGAPLEDLTDLGPAAGVVQIFSGSASGFSVAPTATLSGFRSHRQGDRFGSGVHAVGDFDGDGVDDLGVTASQGDVRQQAFYQEGWSVSGPCVFNNTNSNPLFIFRGTAEGGPQGQPAFALFSNQKGARISSVGVGGDIDGDGRNDLVVGVAGYDYPGQPEDIEDVGSMMVFFGRPAATDGTTQILCEPDLVYVNKTELPDTLLGSSAAIVKSVDGDSCDEVLVGAEGDQDLESREGLVWFVRGWGGLDCPVVPEATIMASRIRLARIGSSMRSGGDYDGDGLVDLIVGNPDFVTEGFPSGALWLVPGAHLATLTTEVLLTERPETVFPLSMPGTSPLLLRLTGDAGDGRFGNDLAVVPSATEGGRDALIIGIPFGREGGTLFSGGAHVVEVNGEIGDADYGFNPIPVAVFGGESSRAGSQFGASVGAGLLGGEPWVAIGGPEASAVTMDNGAVVSFPVVR